jgi:hypothetical protein
VRGRLALRQGVRCPLDPRFPRLLNAPEAVRSVVGMTLLTRSLYVHFSPLYGDGSLADEL